MTGVLLETPQRRFKRLHPNANAEACRRYREANTQAVKQMNNDYRKAHPQAVALWG